MDDFTPSAERGQLAFWDKDGYIAEYGDDPDQRFADSEAYVNSDQYRVDVAEREAVLEEQARAERAAALERKARADEARRRRAEQDERDRRAAERLESDLALVADAEPMVDGATMDERIINALIVCPSKAAAARVAGVARSTIYARLADDDFAERYDTARRRFAAGAAFAVLDSLTNGALEAVATLRGIVADGRAGDAARLKAADTLIRHYSAALCRRNESNREAES